MVANNPFLLNIVDYLEVRKILVRFVKVNGRFARFSFSSLLFNFERVAFLRHFKTTTSTKGSVVLFFLTNVRNFTSIKYLFLVRTI